MSNSQPPQEKAEVSSLSPSGKVGKNGRSTGNFSSSRSLLRYSGWAFWVLGYLIRQAIRCQTAVGSQPTLIDVHPPEFINEPFVYNAPEDRRTVSGNFSEHRKFPENIDVAIRVI